ncbi:MAG: EutN/CcmL family microcompartment protein [Elusimicrobia bacterium]|nr:EutN/CcmL family microcompartment protein [Elusimicrobiota bacterium]
MFVGEVVGNVWGVRKHKSLEGKRLLLVRPIDPQTGKPLGEAILAVDGGVGSGPGSVVLVMDEGGSARSILKEPDAPVRAVVCGVVDTLSLGGKATKYA